MHVTLDTGEKCKKQDKDLFPGGGTITHLSSLALICSQDQLNVWKHTLLNCSANCCHLTLLLAYKSHLDFVPGHWSCLLCGTSPRGSTAGARAGARSLHLWGNFAACCEAPPETEVWLPQEVLWCKYFKYNSEEFAIKNSLTWLRAQPTANYKGGKSATYCWQVMGKRTSQISKTVITVANDLVWGFGSDRTCFYSALAVSGNILITIVCVEMKWVKTSAQQPRDGSD